MADNQDSLKMEPKLAALLAYSLGLITGIIFYILGQNNRLVRFHAMQSIVVFGFITLLWIISPALIFMPVLGSFVRMIVYPILSIASIILWAMLMYKAYSGEYYKLPIAGEIAEKFAGQ